MNSRIVTLAFCLAVFGCSSSAPSPSGKDSSGSDSPGEQPEGDDDDEPSKTNTSPEATSAVKTGDSCSCTNDPAEGDPQLPIIACSGQGQGCKSEKFACVLSSKLAIGKTAKGVCMQQCTNVDQGKQGPCEDGYTCDAMNVGGLMICQ